MTEAVLDFSETKERILDVAEHLFAENGYDGVSVRKITREADTNQSSIYYHFGSKKALLHAVCERRATPINKERVALLRQCLESGENGCPSLDCVLRAFLGPALRASAPGATGSDYRRLFSHLILDPSPDVRSVMADIYDDANRMFIVALRACGLDRDPEKLAWSVLGIYGTMVYAMFDNGLVRRLTGVPMGQEGSEGALDNIVDFLGAALTFKHEKS